MATPVLIPGHMCDARLWTPAVRAVLPGAIDADTTSDDSVDGMAIRALAGTDGMLLPVGFSMGGIVALAMARLAPERMAGLALLDTNPSADLPDRAAVRSAQQCAVRGGELERIVIDELKPNYLAAANQHDRALRDLLRTMALDLGVDVFVAQSEALRLRSDQRGLLPSIDVPVLVACGMEDRLCPPAWHIDMAGQARRSTLHIVAGAGHMLPLEQPTLLASAIDEWINQ